MKVTTFEAGVPTDRNGPPIPPEPRSGATWESPAHHGTDPATGVSCVVYGYVVGHPPSPSGNSRLAETICGLYRDQGPGAAFRHNGVYAIRLFDPRNPAFYLAVDKFGIYPFYFARDGVRVVASSDIAQLLPRFGSELDPEGVEEYLALGYPLGDRTMYRRISRLEAASYIRIDAAGASDPRRYWWLDEIDQPASGRGEDAIRENIECFREVMADHVRAIEKPICFLSSGYDSRRIYLELRAQGVAPDTYTVALPAKQAPAFATIEPKVIERLTAGNPGIRCVLPFPQVAELVELVEQREQRLGFECEEHEWIIPLIESVPDGGWQNFDGLGGDALCNANLLICDPDGVQRYADTEFIVDRLIQISYDRYFKRGWFAGARSTLRERVRAFVEDVPSNPNRIPWIGLLGRARRSTGLAGMALHRGKTSPRFPYLDDRMVAQCARLDPRFRQQGPLQKLAMDVAYPDCAGIPSSHSPAADLEPSFIQPLDARLDFPVAGVRSGFSRPHAAGLIHAARYPVRSNILNWRGRLVVAAGSALVKSNRGEFAARLLRRFWALPQLVKIDRMAATSNGHVAD